MNTEISIDKKLEEINQYLYLHDYVSITKDDYSLETINKMYDLFIHDIVDDKYDDIEYIVALGDYYKNNKSYVLMEEYYLRAIEKNNCEGMVNLGSYYENKKKYKEAKKYYLMGAELGNIHALNALGTYYEQKSDFNSMEKYYLMAIELGNTTSMYNLASHYRTQLTMLEHDINDEEEYEEKKKEYKEKIEKYYLMGIEKGDRDAMYELGYYYYDEKKYDLMTKYYLMAIELNNEDAMIQMAEYYNEIQNYDEMIKYYVMAVEKDNEYAMIKLGEYYEKSKNVEEMKKYYLMAANHGSNQGYSLLSLYYEKQEEYEESLKYLIMISKENPRIRKILGKMTHDEVFRLCKKYDIKLPERIHYRIQFMKNKQKYAKEDDCIICLEKKMVIPYDCFGHNFCERCYYNLEKCPICRISKHPIMNQ